MVKWMDDLLVVQQQLAAAQERIRELEADLLYGR
jgi:hypothetical protein